MKKLIVVLSVLLSLLNVQCVKADNIAEQSFVVKTTNKKCSQRSITKTIDGKSYTFKWNIIFSVKYSYNPNTYKIGTIYSTNVSLENKNYVYDHFDAPKLSNIYNPKATKSSDALYINVKTQYEIKVRQKNSSNTINLGTYEDQTKISV